MSINFKDTDILMKTIIIIHNAKIINNKIIDNAAMHIIVDCFQSRINSPGLELGARPNILFQRRCPYIKIYVAKHTLMKLNVKTGGQPYRVEVMYLREIIMNITSSQDLEKSLTSQRFGIYRFCLTN